MLKSKYAEREIELAKNCLLSNPDDDIQKDRLSWWSAYLGDFETAEKYAVSDKAKNWIEICKRKP